MAASPCWVAARRARRIREHAAGLVEQHLAGEAPGGPIAAQDQLGLRRRHLRASRRRHPRLVELQEGDLLLDGSLVLRELLRAGGGAGGQHGDGVVGAQELGDEPLQRPFHEVEVPGRDVEVVDHDHHVPAGPRGRLLGRARRRVGRRRRGPRRGAALGAQPTLDEHEVRDALRLLVLEHLEVGLGQAPDGFAVRVGHDHVELDDLGPADGRLLLGDRGRARRKHREDGQERERTLSGHASTLPPRRRRARSLDAAQGATASLATWTSRAGAAVPGCWSASSCCWLSPRRRPSTSSTPTTAARSSATAVPAASPWLSRAPLRRRFRSSR